MSIAVLPAKEPPAETRVVLTGVRWSTFEALAADVPVPAIASRMIAESSKSCPPPWSTNTSRSSLPG